MGDRLWVLGTARVHETSRGLGGHLLSPAAADCEPTRKGELVGGRCKGDRCRGWGGAERHLDPESPGGPPAGRGFHSRCRVSSSPASLARGARVSVSRVPPFGGVTWPATCGCLPVLFRGDLLTARPRCFCCHVRVELGSERQGYLVALLSDRTVAAWEVGCSLGLRLCWCRL